MNKNEFDLQLSALGVDFLNTNQLLDANKVLADTAGRKELRYTGKYFLCF